MSRITFSLFGEIECMVARQMMAEGKDIHTLPLTDSLRDAIPHDVRFNSMGQEVRMVVTMPARGPVRIEYERRIEDTRL